jgi:hypothetical protein
MGKRILAGWVLGLGIAGAQAETVTVRLRDGSVLRGEILTRTDSILRPSLVLHDLRLFARRPHFDLGGLPVSDHARGPGADHRAVAKPMEPGKGRGPFHHG